MQATQLITRRSLDKLEEDIISLSSHINATECNRRSKEHYLRGTKPVGSLDAPMRNG